MKQIGKWIGDFFFYVLLITCLCISFNVIKAKVEGVQPSFLGHKVFVVLSGSMMPTFDVGDLIVVKEVEADTIQVSDIITYSVGKDSVVTHRVKEIINNDELEFVTKGDANNIEDMNPVPQENLLGKVIYHFVGIGRMVQWVQENIIVIICVFIFIMMSFYFLFNQFKKLMNIR